MVVPTAKWICFALDGVSWKGFGTSNTRVQAPYLTREFICFAFELHITKMFREKPLPYILQYLDS